MKKMRPHKKGFEPVVGVGCLMASYSYASRPCSGRRESGVDDRVLHSVRARTRTRTRETFRKPPSRLEAQGVEADCEARGKLKNVKARGRFAGHSIAPVEDEPRANSERCYGLPC